MTDNIIETKRDYKKIINLSIKILAYVSYVILIILAVNSKWNDTINLNWFMFIMTSPFIELTYLLNHIFNFAVSYLISFLLAIAMCSYLFKWSLIEIKKIFKVSNEVVPVFLDRSTESYDHLVKFKQIFKKYKFSISTFLFSLFVFYIYFFFIGTYLGTLLSDTTLNVMKDTTTTFLWFDLISGEKYPILFCLFILQTYILTTVKFLLNYFMVTEKEYKMQLQVMNLPDTENTKKTYKANKMYNFLIQTAIYTLVVYAVYVNVAFAIFINFVYLYNNVKTFKRQKL